MILLTTSKKRIYTLKPGTYTGSWFGYFIWVYDIGNFKLSPSVIARIETKKELKGRAKFVTIVIDTPKCYVYEKEKR